MGYLLFILLNAVLFIRPGEIVLEMEDLPIYQLTIFACAVISAPEVYRQLSAKSLSVQPITVCAIAMLIAVILSHLANGSIWDARMCGFAFGKVVLYYLLLVGLIDSPLRLRQFLLCVVGFVTILTALAVLQYRGAIDIPGLDPVKDEGIDPATGEIIIYRRLCSIGIFNDPNDLSLILVMAMVLCLSFLGGSCGRPSGWLWVAPLGLFGYALVLTRSRGGLLALVAALLVLLWERFGGRKAFLLGALVLPLLFLGARGRQTELGTSEGTGQLRIQLWSEGLTAFRKAPLFGIGMGRYEEEFGQVAHNSFIHCFTELGVFGGTCFLGAFYLAFWMLRRLGRPENAPLDPELRRLRPYLTALVAGYAVGMSTITRAYVVPTFMVLGLVSAYLAAVNEHTPSQIIRWDLRLVRRLGLVSVAFVLVAYSFVRLGARWE
jgi:putative inorganic carbon (hco3(-)) transporter